MTPAPNVSAASSPAVIPTLHSLGIPSPAYIRKLRKARDWEEPFEQVLLFDHDTPEHSIYLVSTDIDLYLTIAALNARRQHEEDELYIVYIAPNDFQKVSINPFQTDDVDKIYCLTARRLHHGIIAKEQPEQEKIENLIQVLKIDNRRSIRIKRQQTHKIIEFLRPLGCLSYKSNREISPAVPCQACLDYLPSGQVQPVRLASPSSDFSPPEVSSASTNSLSVAPSIAPDHSTISIPTPPLNSTAPAASLNGPYLSWQAKFGTSMRRCIDSVLSWLRILR